MVKPATTKKTPDRGLPLDVVRGFDWLFAREHARTVERELQNEEDTLP